MLQLTEVINEWNARYRNVERLRIVQANDNPQHGNYAQIGFSHPAGSSNDLLWRSHYEFLQKDTRFSICFHKEDFHFGIEGYRRSEDARYRHFESFVRGIESSIINMFGEIGLNIGEEGIIDNTRRKYFWLNINLPATADAKFACNCMGKLITATYQNFAEQLDEQAMPEFAEISGR